MATYQTAHTGDRDGIALLFDMNVLFEAYVAALARKTLAPLGYKVRAQSPLCRLAHGKMNTDAFQTKPDLHVERDGVVVVLDTKWKRLDPSRRNYDVSQGDAYQMHGYAHVYGARSVVLLYPHHDGFAAPARVQAAWRFEAGGCALELATVDVTDADGCMGTMRSLLARSMGGKPIEAATAG